MLSEAIAYAQDAVNISRGTQLFFLADLAHAYAAAGRQQEAIEVLHKLLQIQKCRYVDPCLIAQIYVVLGEKQLAIKLLEQAVQGRAAWVAYLPTDPWFDPIRADRRFRNLLHDAGLASHVCKPKDSPPV
jgi:tetratricopeptide (TPR) repeat protein